MSGPRGGGGEKEMIWKGDSYYVPWQDKRGTFYKDGGTVEVKRRDVHVG